MGEPIFSEEFWRERLDIAVDREQIHHAIYRCSPEEWITIAKRHRRILADILKPKTSVIDAGCGWGRLLSLMPEWWVGDYLGVDISPDFIRIARKARPDRTFVRGDLRTVFGNLRCERPFDLAIAISIRPMVIQNCGGEEWDKIHGELKKCSRSILYLEYDPDDRQGELENVQ